MITRDFNSAYKEIRNRLRRYRRVSIIRAAISALHVRSPNRLDALKRLPWQILLLVKWALQDRMCNDSGQAEISQNEFSALCGALHNIPERVETIGAGSFHLSMRRVLAQQLRFQQELTTGFVREAAILGRQGPNSSIRAMFETKTGLTLEQFLDYAFATYTAITDDKLKIEFSWYKELRKEYGAQSFQRFLDLMSLDYEGLKSFFESIGDGRRKHLSEFFEFTPLRRFPLLRDGGALHCWEPMVLFRGLEELVHVVLSEAGSEYSEPFSRIFEKHVLAELRSTNLAVLDESMLRSWCGMSSKVPDALISLSHVNIYIEAKSGLFDESVLTVGDAEVFSHKTRSLRTAIYQAWEASKALRECADVPVSIRAAKREYLLVVTNRELGASRGRLLAEMYPSGKLEPVNMADESLLPLDHMYFLSIGDFERLMAAIRLDSLDIAAFIGQCVEGDREIAKSRFYFGQHLDAARIPMRYSDTVQAAAEEVFARVEGILTRHGRRGLSA